MVPPIEFQFVFWDFILGFTEDPEIVNVFQAPLINITKFSKDSPEVIWLMTFILYCIMFASVVLIYNFEYIHEAIMEESWAIEYNHRGHWVPATVIDFYVKVLKANNERRYHAHYDPTIELGSEFPEPGDRCKTYSESNRCWIESTIKDVGFWIELDHERALGGDLKPRSAVALTVDSKLTKKKNRMKKQSTENIRLAAEDPWSLKNILSPFTGRELRVNDKIDENNIEPINTYYQKLRQVEQIPPTKTVALFIILVLTLLSGMAILENYSSTLDVTYREYSQQFYNQSSTLAANAVATFDYLGSADENGNQKEPPKSLKVFKEGFEHAASFKDAGVWEEIDNALNTAFNCAFASCCITAFTLIFYIRLPDKYGTYCNLIGTILLGMTFAYVLTSLRIHTDSILGDTYQASLPEFKHILQKFHFQCPKAEDVSDRELKETFDYAFADSAIVKISYVNLLLGDTSDWTPEEKENYAVLLDLQGQSNCGLVNSERSSYYNLYSDTVYLMRLRCTYLLLSFIAGAICQVLFFTGRSTCCMEYGEPAFITKKLHNVVDSSVFDHTLAEELEAVATLFIVN